MTEYVLALVCVTGLSVGQLLFQRAAMSLNRDSVATVLTSLLGNAWFWSAVILYGTLTFLWTYVLSRLPLQFAYPVYGFSFLLVPVLAAVFFEQSIDWRTIAGGVLIFGGILVSASGKLV